jgi:CHAT domain-containing protein/tetratricopeptide (TPR) repeat protein
MTKKEFHVSVLAAIAASLICIIGATAQTFDLKARLKPFDQAFKAGQYDAALSEAKKFEALVKKQFGTNSSVYGLALMNLAEASVKTSRLDEAERLYQRALDLFAGDSSIGAQPQGVLLIKMARLYESQRRYKDAVNALNRALQIFIQVRDPQDAAVALGNLGELDKTQGRYDRAEDHFKQALAIRESLVTDEKARSDQREVAWSLNQLALLYHDQGRDDEAEPLFRKSLAIREKAFGPDHPDVSESLNNLAAVYRSQNRRGDAVRLLERSLAITKSDGLTRMTILNNLGALYHELGRVDDAELLSRQSLAIATRMLGPSNPDVALALNSLAVIYKDQGRYVDAEPLLKKSLEIFENTRGPDHPDVAASIFNLGDLYGTQGRNADAESLLKRSLKIREKTLGAEHPEVARTLTVLASFYQVQGRTADALSLMPKVIAGRQALPTAILPTMFAAQRENLIPAEQAIDHSLNVVQLYSMTSAASAVGNLGVRLAAGNDRLAQLVRKDQDLTSEAEALDRSIVAAVSMEPSRRNAAAEQRTRDRLTAIATERAALQKVFAAEFPNYAALSNPLPMTAKDVQSLLSEDEALILFSVSGSKHGYVFALTRDRVDWKQIPLGADALSQKVAAFRRGLDVNKIAGSGDTSAKSGLFDLGLANELYTTLLGPLKALIKDKKHLLIVPSGALTALPFHLLVTEKPPAAIPERFDGYRDAAWLIKRQAVSVLPSVASLKALRAFARSDQSSKPMIGFGDPVFDPNTDGNNTPVAAAKPSSTKSATRNLTHASYTDFWQGAGIDRSKLAQALPQLPDTADELNAVALKLGAPASDIHLGRDASETTLKRSPLADYGIVYFATHGLVAGDVKGLAEPSLVLSIPKQPSELDDGLLTASEVAQLKLNADWVVLSACNTIAGDKPGAEALSGLARSFFYAGARALLVSHWSVDSAAATRLTISTFDNLKANPAIGHAEALRRAMLGYLNDASLPENAYPAFWGPFALIGEGAAR